MSADWYQIDFARKRVSYLKDSIGIDEAIELKKLEDAGFKLSGVNVLPRDRKKNDGKKKARKPGNPLRAEGDYKKLLSDEQFDEFKQIKDDSGFAKAGQWANGQLSSK